MRKALFLLTLTLVLALAAGSAWADAVTGLTNFTSGTPAIANSVNANFAEVANSVDDNDTRVTALEDTVPGLASEYISTSTYPAAAYTVANSVSIDAPGAGYILVLTNVGVSLDHVTGTSSYFHSMVDDTRATANLDHVNTFQLPADVPTGSYVSSFNNQLIDSVASSGTYTYYLNVAAGGAGSQSRVHKSKITAIFLPTSYGTVDISF